MSEAGASTRFDELAGLVRKARSAVPDEAVPCFAHLRVESGGRKRDLLFGPRASLDRGVTLLAWSTAPLARVLFGYDEGEDYELEIEDRSVEGTVLEKHLLFLENGELVALEGTTGAWRRGDDGNVLPSDRAPVLGLELGAAPSRTAPSPIEVPLDDVQRRAVEEPPGHPMLVTGEAGAGKTTVALHRLARLVRESQARTGEAPKTLVVLPFEGLRRLTEGLLDRLGVTGVDVVLYDRWVAGLARRAFRGLPTRTSKDLDAAVLRLKRHRALRVALEELAGESTAEPELLDETDEGKRRPARVSREDLLHLFGDRARLERVVLASGGTIRPTDVERVALHTRAQFERTTEDEFADVTDATKLRTLDERRIDAGTPNEGAGRIDTEDFAALFALDRLRARRRGAPDPALPKTYEAVVLDEAQELAPLELELVGRSVAPGGTLVVAGDAGQQMDETAGFVDFATTMHDLGAPAHGVTILETSYRCPKDVTELAKHVLDPSLPLPALGGLARGEGTIADLHAENGCHLLAAIADVLRRVARESAATAAVITRDAESARRMAPVLAEAVGAKLALEGDFDFRARFHVTTVRDVKGLEFDLVIVPDATAATYPDEPVSRRSLYVALTRASWRLVLGGVGKPSPLLA